MSIRITDGNGSLFSVGRATQAELAGIILYLPHSFRTKPGKINPLRTRSYRMWRDSFDTDATTAREIISCMQTIAKRGDTSKYPEDVCKFSRTALGI